MFATCNNIVNAKKSQVYLKLINVYQVMMFILKFMLHLSRIYIVANAILN